MAARHLPLIILVACSTSSGGPGVIATMVEPGAVRIDGRLDERAWAVAETYHLRHSLTSQTPTVETHFRVLADGQAIYFGIACEQPDMAGLKATRTERDSGVWSDDCVEIFVDPAGKGEEYFQFVVNALGTVFDARYMGGRNQDRKWDAEGARAAGHRADHSWSLELVLPICNFAVPQVDSLTPADVSEANWRLNIGREYRGGRPRLLTFVPLDSFFEPREFAPLKGVQAMYERFHWRIGPVDLKRVRPDNGAFLAELDVGVENLTGQFRAFELTAEAVLPSGRKKLIVVAPLFGADARQTQILPFQVRVHQEGTLGLRMRVTDRKLQELVAWRDFSVPVHISPLALSVTKPFYRSAIYATMDLDEIEVELSTLWDLKLADDDRLGIVVRDGGGRATARVCEADRKAFIGRHRIAIPKLEPGDYVCEASITRAGKALHSAEAVLHVYSPSASEVRVNENLNFVIDGRETFLVGSFHFPWSRPSLERCNAAITYSTAHDLDQKPEVRERLSQLARDGRAMMIFPHPKSVWTHQVGGRVDLAGKPLRPDHAKLIGERVAQYSRQPGLLGWYMADEPSPHLFLPAYLEALADTIRASDPYHPCYLSYNFGSAAAVYDRAVDACGLHYYVGFTDRGAVYPIASIAKHMALAQDGVRHRKAVVFSPQLIIFSHQGNQDIRPVRHVESRCMAYLAIVHGAKGIIWFSAGGIKSSLEIRIGLPVLIDELRTLERVFLAHHECGVRVTGAGQDDVHALAKKAEEQVYLIAVNAAPHARKATLHLPTKWAEISRVYELDGAMREAACMSGQLPLQFQPYEVRIFTTDPSASRLVSRDELAQRFEAQRREFLALGNLCYQARGTKVRVSDGYGIVGKTKLVIDGYKGHCHECPRRAKKGSWVEVVFPRTETVARIEVSSNSSAKRNFGRGRLRDYELALLTDGQWAKVSGATREDADDQVFTRIHEIAPTRAKALRLTMAADAQKVGCVNEIQAFSAH